MATRVDDFTGANGDLSGHTATPDAGTWSEVEDTLGTLAINIQSSNGTASPSGGSNSNRIIYAIDWVPDTANYWLSLEATVDAGGDDTAALIARYVDTSNYYALVLLGTAAVVIVKKVAGTFTNIAAASVTTVNGDIWKFELIGTTLKGYQNDVERVSVTDSSHSAKGVTGFGFGNIGGIELEINLTTADISASWDVDDFTLEDIDVPEDAPIVGQVMPEPQPLRRAQAFEHRNILAAGMLTEPAPFFTTVDAQVIE